METIRISSVQHSKKRYARSNVGQSRLERHFLRFTCHSLIFRNHYTDQDTDEAERDDGINDREPLVILETGPHSASKPA